MKLSPRASLALVLAAGVAVPALAQTSSTTSPSSQPASPTSPTMGQGGGAGWNAAHPQSSYATEPQQPQSGAAQPQANYAPPPTGASPAMSNGQTAPNYSQTMTPGSAADTNAQFSSRAATQTPQNQQIQQAQSRLSAAGLYNGPQDGLMDPDTRAAIARFQEQHRLPRTETLDAQTTAALMSNQETTGSGSSAPSTTPMAPNAGQGASQGQGQPMPPPPSGAGGNTQPQPSR